MGPEELIRPSHSPNCRTSCSSERGHPCPQLRVHPSRMLAAASCKPLEPSCSFKPHVGSGKLQAARTIVFIQAACWQQQVASGSNHRVHSSLRLAATGCKKRALSCPLERGHPCPQLRVHSSRRLAATGCKPLEPSCSSRDALKTGSVFASPFLRISRLGSVSIRNSSVEAPPIFQSLVKMPHADLC